MRLEFDVAPHEPLSLMLCAFEFVQLPKSLWQPVPQYAVVEPQNPLGEQQFPNVLVRQVELVSEFEPQLPSVLVGESRDKRTGLKSSARL